MSDSYDWGKKAEQLAADYLLRKGYLIRERNWRPKMSKTEIDIISQIDNVIIFIEVKARQNTDFDPADAIDRRKIQALIRAGRAYLNLMQYDYEFRFDVVTISGTEDNYTIDHLEDAFLPPLTTR